jgi:hypothetical protein
MARIFEYLGFSSQEWSVSDDLSKEAEELVGLPDDYYDLPPIDEDQFMRVMDGLEDVPEDW